MTLRQDVRHLRLFALLLALGGATACSATAPTRTGFLGDYAALRPDERNPRDPVYAAPDVTAGRYRTPGKRDAIATRNSTSPPEDASSLRWRSSITDATTSRRRTGEGSSTCRPKRCRFLMMALARVLSF